MADQDPTTAVLQQQAGKLFGGLPAINPYGMESKDYDDYDAQIQKLKTDLQERYKNPNWFDVAAGFAKPTGGNFLASLGNASEALARNVEQERAQAMPIAQLELESYRIKQMQKQAIQAKTILDKELASGKGVSPDALAKITALVTKDHPIAQAADAQSQTKIAQQRSQMEVGNYTQQQLDAANKNPLLKFIQEAPDKVGQVVQVSPEAAKQSEANLDNILLKTNSPDVVKGMNFAQKQQGVAAITEANSRRSMTQKDRDADIAMNSSNRLADLNEARYLATRPGMDGLFGLFNSGDGLNLLKTLANASGDKYAQASAAIQEYIYNNFANNNPKLRMEADQLMKLVNKLSLDTRNASSNPTNLVQEMASNVNPDFRQSHKGFLSILDQLGFEDKFNVDKSNLRNKTTGIDPNAILSNDEFRQLQAQYKRERSQHSTLDPTQHMPSWYVALPGEGQVPATPAAAPAPASATNTSASAPRPSEAPRQRSSLSEAIRRSMPKKD
jgi:hypothetical protein